MFVYLDSNGLIASYLAIYKQASLKYNEHVRESTEFIPAADETQEKNRVESPGVLFFNKEALFFSIYKYDFQALQ